MSRGAPLTDRQRFWRLMRLMLAVAIAGVVAVLGWLHVTGTPLRLQFALAVGLGVFCSVALAGALMGLLFFSDRSGHDDSVRDDYLDEEDT